MKFFCPNCFAEISEDTRICPQCETDIAAWMSSHNYFQRLIKALKHPVSEVRMSAIMSLGNQGNSKAAGPLVDCAFDWPADTVQNLEILVALTKLPLNADNKKALKRLHDHPARIIREKADNLLTNKR